MRRIDLPETWKGRAAVILAAENAAVSGEATRDDREWFSEAELAIAGTLRLPKRRAEWKLSRIAAKQLAVELGLCRSPVDCVVDRPRLIVNGRIAPAHVSISHSHGYAGAAIDEVPVGIDVEKLREIRPSAAHLFLTGDEAATAGACNIEHALLHFWAAKEAAWKQREGEIETLKKMPLKLEAETATGLRFDVVETIVMGGIVLALTRPIS